VIHRDLKPANILLGSYGETLVVDWGLAKIVGRGETAAPAGPAEATLQPGSGSGSSETLPGTALGTPSYMSPEQAEGRLEQVGPLSDVYSLGATLYCLLTGKPPIAETDVGEALRRAQRGEFAPPRVVNSPVPRALDAICLKAMASRPEERHSSPRALADDIEHWLADEPVAVYREPLTTRLTRWCRRHRTAAVGIGVLLLTAMAALAISTVLIGSEQARTQKQFYRAEANLTLANDKAREAFAKAESLRREDYAHRISIALREIQDDGNVALADSLLDGCPVDLRGWEWNYVKRQAHLDRFTYRGHLRGDRPDISNSVDCVAISPDGRWAASGTGIPWSGSRHTDRAEIRLWDIETGRERRAFDDLIGTVHAVAISRDSKLLAATGGHHELQAARGWLKLWDATTRTPIRLPTESVSGMVGMGVAFSPDGKFLAVGYGDYLNDDPVDAPLAPRPGRLTLIDLATGKEWTPARATDTAITGLAFCPDADRPLLAVSGKDGVEVWDWKSRTFLKQSPKHDGNPLCLSVAVSRDGQKIAMGEWDNRVRLWEPAADKEPRTLYRHKGYPLSVAFSPDGTLIASVGEDRSIRLWELATGRELANFRGHTGHVFAVAFHPDPYDRRILSGGIEGVVKVWDRLRSRPVIYRGHSGWVTGVAFSQDGRIVATESDTWSVFHAFHPEVFTEELRKTMKMDTQVWDPDTGEQGSPPSPGVDPAFASFSRFEDLTVTSPDGRRVLKVILYDPREEAPSDRDVRVIDVASGRVLLTLVGHTDAVTCVAFSPDGRRIATASDDRTLKLWDSETGQEVLTLRDHTAGVTCVAFSPDGHRLVSGSVDRTARIWDATPLATGDLPADLSAH
jgi:WD40 repeat protein